MKEMFYFWYLQIMENNEPTELGQSQQKRLK